jgi:hypothetical protein
MLYVRANVIMPRVRPKYAWPKRGVYDSSQLSAGAFRKTLTFNYNGAWKLCVCVWRYARNHHARPRNGFPTPESQRCLGSMHKTRRTRRALWNTLKSTFRAWKNVNNLIHTKRRIYKNKVSHTTIIWGLPTHNPWVHQWPIAPRRWIDHIDL